MAGDQEHRPVSSLDCPFKVTVDRAPCLIEIETMQIEHAVGLDHAGTKLAVPG
jgi:hypothetical protein